MSIIVDNAEVIIKQTDGITILILNGVQRILRVTKNGKLVLV